MSQQLTLDQAVARACANDGMRASIMAAERAHAEWPDQALRFFEAYSRCHLVFTCEEVVACWKAFGLRNPPNDRAWGWVVKNAKAAGMIVFDGYAPRAKGHASPGPRWRSKIYCVVPT